MTVDTVQLYARYNAHANGQMNQILAAVSPEEWRRERGGYYSSVASTLAHIYNADVGWLVRLSGLRRFASLQGEPFDFPPSPGQFPFESFDDYLNLRRRLDRAWLEFSGEVTNAELNLDYSYRNSSGEEMTKNFGSLILHAFNHQTHHRGMVALYLDQMGVPNDFSDLLDIL